jgi:hypothetical protein
MPDSIFPERPWLPVQEPVPVVKVVRREPLAAIQEILSISIDHVVNDARTKCVVADLYRLTRKVENESWLRRCMQAQEHDDWIADHL